MKKTFTDRVREVVRKIPRGSVLTYQEVARLAGNERACRVVGNIMKHNYDPTVPCHRVIRKVPFRRVGTCRPSVCVSDGKRWHIPIYNSCYGVCKLHDFSVLSELHEIFLNFS